jgi:hypothetical protein
MDKLPSAANFCIEIRCVNARRKEMHVWQQ